MYSCTSQQYVLWGQYCVDFNIVFSLDFNIVFSLEHSMDSLLSWCTCKIHILQNTTGVHHNADHAECMLGCVFVRILLTHAYMANVWYWVVRSVGSFKLLVSFAEYCLFYGALLQKRPIIVSILLTKATPYAFLLHNGIHI